MENMRRFLIILINISLATSFIHTRYPLTVKEPLGKLVQMLKKAFQKTDDENRTFLSKRDKSSELKVLNPYLYLAVKDETAKEIPNDKEQTTDKRMIDNSIDYWYGGGRFGKRYSDYGLTKTRFGRSLDHVDLNEEDVNS